MMKVLPDFFYLMLNDASSVAQWTPTERTSRVIKSIIKQKMN